MIIAVLCGAVVGLALGLTGGGGSIFAVPLLIYGVQLEPHAATTVSLAAVGLIALAGAVDSARTGLVELRCALLLAVTGMAAAPLGVTLAGHAPDEAIIVGFALLMLTIAGRMWTHAGSRPAETRAVRAGLGVTGPVEAGPVCRYSVDGQLHLNAPCSAALAGCGLVVGALSGFFGVGGGFLIVPALLAITQMGIHRAVATSLLVIALIGAAGVAASWWQGRDVVWALAMLFALGGLAGMSLGRVLAARLAGPALQRLFALSMTIVAALMLSGQLDYF
ncbi:MAG: sulfite exporter TauE/SafE family protein [Gammaproteobacteria bacterium]